MSDEAKAGLIASVWIVAMYICIEALPGFIGWLIFGLVSTIFVMYIKHDYYKEKSTERLSRYIDHADGEIRKCAGKETADADKN